MSDQVDILPQKLKNKTGVATPKFTIVYEELEEVKHKWWEIGMKLHVPYNKLKEFKKEDDRELAEVINYWLKGNIEDVAVTWESIVTALESSSVSETGLAQIIMKKYCQPTRVGSSEQTLCTNQDSSNASDQVKKVHEEPKNSVTDDSSDNGGKVNPAECLPITFSSLSDRFQEIGLSLLEELQQKKVEVIAITNHISVLPAPLLQECHRSTEESFDKLEKCNTLAGLIRFLNAHVWNFIDYHLLEFIVSKFGSQHLKQRMKQYVIDLKEYNNNATVHEFMQFWPARPKPQNWGEITVKLDKDPKLYTMRELDKFRQSLSVEFWPRLSDYAKFVMCHYSHSEGCFQVTWIVPPGFVSECEAVARSDSVLAFLVQNKVLSVAMRREGESQPSEMGTHYTPGETLDMWFIKVILLGPPRLGKTTMRRRLTGEIDDISSSGEGEQPSTGVVESGPSIVIRNLSSTTALITESEWIATKDLTEEMCAILPYSTSQSAVSHEYWREITQKYRDTVFLNVADVGGQPEFLDMQSILTFGPALYLLFCKLTDDLDSLYKVSYLSSTGESTAKEFLFTSLANIACSSSLSLGETTSFTVHADQLLASCNKSIAYIIGTHKDRVSEEQIDEFDQKLQQCIRPTDFFKEDIIQFASEERMVLPVDNMHGGRDEIRSVHKLLEDSMKKHFKKLSIPASWLKLGLCLRKREERTASLECVLQLASELGIAEEEAMVALWFLHHYAGVLMYFPNLPELKDTVICDNQIVYDSATNLFVNTFTFRSVGKAASECFRKTGQFSLEDIRRATAGVSGDYIPFEKLVKLLAFLNILVSFVKSTSTSLSSRTLSSEEMYFMPSVLLNATHEEMASWWDHTHKQVSPALLFITYQCGFVPIGVFPAMIANLTVERSLKLRVKGIRKNRVEFLFGRDFDTITLVSQPTYYAVHISRRKSTNTPTHEVCATVRGLVESTLKTVTSRMNYTFTAEYQLGFECPSHPGREHLCVIDSDDPSPHVMCCQENMDNFKPVDMQSQHLVWFGECPSFDDSGNGWNRLQGSKKDIEEILLF